MTFWQDLGVGIVVLAVAVVVLLGRSPIRARRWPFAATLACIGLAALTAAAAWYPLTILFAIVAVGLGIVTLVGR